MKLNINGKDYDVEVQPDSVSVDGTSFKVTILRDNGDTTVRVAGRPYKIRLKDEKRVVVDGREYAAEISGSPVAVRSFTQTRVVATAAATARIASPSLKDEPGGIYAPMPGKVRSVLVSEGQKIASGAVVAILEAMKMENEIRAPQGGTVKRIAVTAGQAVSKGDTLVVIE
ncbi:MAG: biotin/lipoyl-binding protein [Chloroflexi bacterium]|nr:biotin/lipoyl-binding protein [Chloroflexota bacterium]